MSNSVLKFCVIGDPIDHSLSPLMQNFFLKKFKINGNYAAKRVKINDLKNAIQSFMIEGVTGINVTTPLKNEVLNFVDELTCEAKIVGSVNTIKISNGNLIGHNTDAIGFQTSLQIPGYSFKDKTAIIFGAGGAARAVVVALIREQCNKIVITNRNLEKANRLVEGMINRFPKIQLEAIPMDNPEICNQIKSCQLLVNATTVGMGNSRDQSIIQNKDCLHEGLLVYDLIYRPYRTRLIQQAETCHVPWTNGIDMLIFQGIESLKFWVDQNLTLEESIYFEIKNILRREVCQE